MLGAKIQIKLTVLVLLIFMAFVLGWAINYVGVDFSGKGIHGNLEATSKIIDNSSKAVIDLASPYSRIGKDEVNVLGDKVIISIKNPLWAAFTDTKSMDPVIDSSTKSIQVEPVSYREVHVGDIVAYQPAYMSNLVAHRVVETSFDDIGWYAILKGDNNSHKDPGKVRFDQIKRIVVMLIY